MFADYSLKAVATLWERSETEIEAVHLAIALAYHGLLRVPSRAETSELGPCMSSRNVFYGVASQ